MKKKRVLIQLIIFIYILGCGVLMYPTLRDFQNNRQVNQAVEKYENAINNYSANENVEQRRIAKNYNSSLLGTILLDAFDERSNITNPEYESILNPIGDGCMGVLEIPSLNIKEPIYHYTTGESLKKGVGHVPGSSFPVGGENSHTILAIPNDQSLLNFGAELESISLDNIIYLHVLEERLAYKVESIKTVEPNEIDDLPIVMGKDLCTIVMAVPKGINSHRFLVRGTRIPYTDEQYQNESKSVGSQNTMNSLFTRIILMVFGLIVLVGIAFYINRKTRSIEEQNNKTIEQDSSNTKNESIEHTEESKQTIQDSQAEEIHKDYEEVENKNEINPSEETEEPIVGEIETENSQVVEEATKKDSTVDRIDENENNNSSEKVEENITEETRREIEPVVEEKPIKKEPYRRRALPYITDRE